VRKLAAASEASLAFALDVLVCGAFHPELGPLVRVLGSALSGSVGGRSVAARIVGVGLPAAAAGAASLLAPGRPGAVVLTGTCGAYRGSGFAIGDVAVSRRVHLVDGGAVRGLSEFPGPMPTALDADRELVAALASAGALPADVAATLAITVDDDAATQIARATGTQVEHLEAYGVATACAAVGVPFVAVLGVANFVGSTARAEWRANHEQAAGAAVSRIVRWLEGPAAS
jgi:futalosine hydrolase